MNFNRRQFIGGTVGGFSAFAARIGGDPLAIAQQSSDSSIRRCVVLWMNGGPSQFETFDPKPNTQSGGDVGVIETSVPGLMISELLPEMAKRMHRLSVVRNLSSTEGEHLRAQYYMHTGYPKIDSFPRPALGAIAAYDAPESDIPQYVSLGSPGFGPAFLGPQNGPFSVQDPGRAREMLNVIRRRKSRLEFLRDLCQDFSVRHPNAAAGQRRAMLQQIERLVDTPFANALDLQQESGRRRESYGSSEFAHLCLLARRLLETGVRFIEIQQDGWDSHTNNLSTTRRLCGNIDRPWAMLVDELAASGLLSETVVLWMGEFGRTPTINGTAGRDHFPTVSPVVMGGAGLKSGQIIGATNPSGREIAGPSVSAPDLFATVLTQIGITPDREFTTAFDSPTPATDSGTPIAGLL